MHVDRAEAEDGDDGRLGLVGWHAVVVRVRAVRFT
jgi:hypothetical protein